MRQSLRYWWLYLLSVAMVIVICGSTDLNDNELESYTKTITAINGETGEALDGCRWRSQGEWFAEDTDSITRTEEPGKRRIYNVNKGDWWGVKIITFTNNKPEKILMKRYDQNGK